MAVTRRTDPITGMTCASYVLSVEKALRSEPGVQEVNVNLATHTARVRWPGTAVDVEGLRTGMRRR